MAIRIRYVCAEVKLMTTYRDATKIVISNTSRRNPTYVRRSQILVYNHRINAILGSYNFGDRRHPELHHYQTETTQVLPSLISISYLF